MFFIVAFLRHAPCREPQGEKTMRSTIAVAASVALVLSSSIAFAGGKKAGPADPRTNNTIFVSHKGGGFTTTCDIDPNCNGWAAWLAQQQKKG